ncbi:MAG: iron-containing alcohol dehydrogenase [Betaproteobacteria bacterium]
MADVAKPFVSVGQVFFGVSAIERLPVVLKELGVSRTLLVTDKGVTASGAVSLVEQSLRRESIATVVFDDTQPEPGVEVVERVVGLGRDEKIDGIVGMGGGSSMDTAKMASILLKFGGNVRDYLGEGLVPGPGLPMVLVPTTAGTGSESTPNALFVVDGEKQAVVSRHLVPRAAIVDPTLTLSVPPSITASAGVDALVHACETYTSLGSTPLSEMYSLRAVELIAGSIRTAVWQGSDLKARTDMALGSFLAGVAITNAGTGAVHALAYPLGGRYRVPHGVSNSLMFPYVAEYNVLSDLPRFTALAKALGEKVDGLSIRDAALCFVKGVRAIIQDVGLPRTLAEVGIGPSEIPHLVDVAARQTRLLKNNPRVLTRNDIEAIYRKALGL